MEIFNLEEQDVHCGGSGCGCSATVFASYIYEKLIKKDEIHEKSSNIYSNYEYFLKLIDESELSPEEIYKGMYKLEIVYIALDAEKENPQLIFESLNSTGLDLTQADLIRNYLLMGLNYELQNNLYENNDILT